MKASIFKLAVVAVASLSFVANSAAIFAAPAPIQQDAAAAQEEGLIFNWKNAPWPDVIDWFADQAGFVVDPATQYPEGTFSLKSDQPYSPLEAIDEINHKLLLGTPPKTLLRNGNRLYLVEADKPLPGALVETIDVADLDNRGIYEILQVKFDVSGLDLDSIEDQVKQRISQHNLEFFEMYPTTNEMFVRETGENLRFIRDMIALSKTSKTPSYTIMELEFISAELFVERIRSIHGLNDDNRTDDGDLIILIDSVPGTQRLIVRGTPEKIRDIESLKKISDLETDTIAISGDDPLVTKRYPVTRDTQETFEVIDRLLFEEGGGARAIQGGETGTITVRGRKRDHGVVREYLDLLDENSGGFKTVDLENGNATDIAADTQMILGITSENLAESVRLLPNDDGDYIIVKGTPIQVTEAVQVIEELDRKAAPTSDGLRTPRIVIPMAAGDRDRILDILPDVLPTMGRKNPFEVRKPKQSVEEGSLFRKREKQSKEMMRDQGSILRKRMFEFAVVASPSLAMNLSQCFLQSPDDPSPGDKMNPEAYQSPEQVKTVPGAPLQVWGTEFGIIIECDDLDAGEDVAYLVDQLLGEESEEARPQIYQLVHIEASQLKAILESMFGLSSDSGGGGGGLLGGLADNALGDAAGGMVDSLFGGGGSDGGSAALMLEGDVSFGVDGRLNYLWVIGATENDLAKIDPLIETWDISSPPQNPETEGQLYEIVIKHRDPEEIKMKIETLWAKYLKDEEGGQQQGGGNEQANIARMMRAMTGGGGGGGGASQMEEKKPTAKLDFDAKTGKLFLLGPRSIFVQIQKFVLSVDVPEVDKPMKMVVVKVSKPKQMAEMLKGFLGAEKLELKGMGESEEGEEAMMEGPTAGRAQAGGGNRNAAQTQARQQTAAAQIQAFQRAAQAQQRAGGRGGQGGGQGGGRGGRGGGRGGR